MRFLLLLAAACLLTAQDPSVTLNKLYAEYHTYTIQQSPELATSMGIPGSNDRWSDVSPQATERRRAELRRFQQRAQAFSPSALKPADRLNQRLFVRGLQDQLDSLDLNSYLLPINHFFAAPHLGILRTLPLAPTKTAKDFDDRLARLNAIPQLIDQSIATATEALRRNLKAPRHIATLMASQLEQQIAAPPEKSQMLAEFRAMPKTISDADRARLQAQATAAYRDAVQPALQKLHRFLTTTYIPQTRTTLGLSDNFNGKEHYQTYTRLHTTTKLSPDAIHDIGLKEAARIQSEMAAIRAELKFTGTAAEFTAQVLDGPQFRFHSEQEILAHGREISKRLDPELPRLFKILPRMPYGVQAIPAHQARTAAPFYQPPARDGSRAGNFFLRTVDPETQSKCCMEALILHEAVPGHHLQIALAQEMGNVPEFRKNARFTAFSEGWGLYAETLGTELGLYRSPYERYGRLQSELFRAIRLVVDTGIHAKGWTREQAIQAMQPGKGGWLNDAFIASEIDRYIAVPGQALAYKIGGLKISELRAKSEKALGPKFDIREFHDAVLRNGALPLDMLEEQIDAYIASK